MHFGVLHLRGAMGCSVGSYHTNNQAVEVQLMRKFLREQQILSADMPSEADDMLNVLNPHCPGSLLESCFDPYNKTILKLQSLASCNINGNMTFHFYCQILTLNCCHQNVKESLPLGMRLFCFFSHLFFFLAILFFLTYYAQYFARSFNILLKV